MNNLNVKADYVEYASTCNLYNSKSYTVYILFCPIRNEVKYIGSTKGKILYRYSQHIKDKSKSKKSKWIRMLKRLLLVPTLIIVKDNMNYIDSRKLEIKLIRDFSCKSSITNVIYTKKNEWGYYKN